MTDGGQEDGAEAAASGARRAVLAAAAGHILARAVHLAVELGLADALAGGAKTARQLAAEIAADETALRRLLHFLARHGFFAEGGDGRFEPTATGRLLRSDAPANTAEVVRSLGSPAVWNAFGILAQSVRSGRPPEERRGGRLYERRGDLPHEAMLSRAMTGYHAGEPEAVAAAYDFGPAARILDVGGSSGHLIGALLLRHPHLHGIVYDRPGIEAEARAYLGGLGLAGRFDFAGGDFFHSVPAGADLYILSHILHDWSDRDALRILLSCRSAMAEGARLIVLEALMTGDGGGESEIPADMLLLANSEGRLRTLAEHRDLLDRAGLRFCRTMACGPLVSLIEAERRDGRARS